jgi:hypothetical protein
VPGFFVNIWKRDFAIARVDALDAGLALGIQSALRCGTVGKFDLIGLVGHRFAGLIEQFDFDPVARSGRTCRVP